MGPVARIHGLPVVVDIDAERPGRAGHGKLAVHEGCDAVEGEKLRFGPRFAQAVTDVERGPGDVLAVAGTVRVCQQLGEVPDDLGLVGLSVGLRDVTAGLGGEGGRGDEERDGKHDRGAPGPQETDWTKHGYAPRSSSMKRSMWLCSTSIGSEPGPSTAS